MLKRLVIGALLSLSLAAPAMADYASCRDTKCGPGSRGYTSCKYCNDDVNICCRDEYDNHTATLSQYIACTSANARGYVACTGGLVTVAVGTGSEAERLKADRDAASIVMRELARLVVDLNAKIAASSESSEK